MYEQFIHSSGILFTAKMLQQMIPASNFLNLNFPVCLFDVATQPQRWHSHSDPIVIPSEAMLENPHKA